MNDLYSPFQNVVKWSGIWKSDKDPELFQGAIEIYLREPYHMVQTYTTLLIIHHRGAHLRNDRVEEEVIVKVNKLVNLYQDGGTSTYNYTIIGKHCRYLITELGEEIHGVYLNYQVDDNGLFVIKLV